MACTPANLCEKTTFSQAHADYLYYSTGARCYMRYDQIHTMIDPAGNKTEFRYRTSKEQEDENMHGLLINQTYYAGGGPGTTVQTKKTVQYGPVQYCSPCGSYIQLDTGGAGDAQPDFEMAQQQIVTTWQDDEDDSGAPLTVPTQEIDLRSQFDNFGHYQREELSGTAIGDEEKVIIKDYANDNLNGSGQSCQPNIPSNWLGDVVAREEVHKILHGIESTLSRTDYGYDTVRGIRTSAVRRTDFGTPISLCTNAPAPSAGDMVTEYTFTGTGDVASERDYVPGIVPPTSSPSDVTARFTYSYGSRDSGKNDGFSYYDWTRTIDLGSGLPTAQRDHPTSPTDTSAVTTTFAYDVLGRTTKITHGVDLPLTITYDNAHSPVSSNPGYMLADIKSTQGSGDNQTESVDHFLYGRFDHAEKLNPDGSRAYRYTLYNSAGSVSFVTEWTRQGSNAGVPGTATDYGVYDASGNYLFEEPFGRPSTVTDALGNVTKYHYFGLNKEVTVKNVALKATALDDPADVKTRYYTDALNRLRVVSAPVVVSLGVGHGPYEETGAAGRYVSDVLGRMVQADVASSVTVAPSPSDRYFATTPAAQSRYWSYDSLGRLTSTTSPEAGTLTNLGWNALGQVTETQDANGNVHSTTFDAGGRPTSMKRGLLTDAPVDNTFLPQNLGWAMSGAWRYDANSCFGSPAWTIDDSSSCHYAQSGAISNATLTSPLLSLTADSILTFQLYREVRAEGSGSGHDTLRVSITNGKPAPNNWTEIYRIDASQISWPKWVQTAAIPLKSYLINGQQQIMIRFDSGDQTPSPQLRGIGIGPITVRHANGVLIQSTTYDQNAANGKPTTMQEYDDATRNPIFTRVLHYTDPNGRLSDETMTFDWNRAGAGAAESLVDQYHYDAVGNPDWEVFPHVPNTSARQYNFPRTHGALVGVNSTFSGGSQNFIPSSATPGIQYNDAGGMSLVRYQNGLQEHIATNAAFLPSQMWVDHGNGLSSFDTGAFVYDGARNVKQIGADYYRYDAANRLTWARTSSNLYGNVDLDEVYDVYGNMTAQTATYSTGGNASLPYGYTFSGRTYSNNKIAGFTYDANGNLTDESAHDGLLAQSYIFTSDNRLAHVTDGSSTWSENALYEGDDHRWFRSLWADGGKALITVRDASGQVASDFLESSATSGLAFQKDYVHANGQLVAVESTCGPRPALALSTPASDGNVWFDRTDYVTPSGTFTVYVTTSDGQYTTILEPSSTPSHFAIPQSLLFPNVTNFIQIESYAACGHTGYSNAVSYGYSSLPGGGSCLNTIGASRSNFNGTGSNLQVGSSGTCPGGTTYNVYFQATGSSTIQRLNPLHPLTASTIMISSLPCGSGEGNYWIAPIPPGNGGNESTPSLQLAVGGASCGGGGEAAGGGGGTPPGQPSMNAQYISWDHLGSTRLVTDEDGATIDAFKYYPFGLESETLGADVRQKFTGHERDDATGLDYMMARSCRMALTRFLTPDPYDESVYPSNPQSWNRYSYVLNNAVNGTDPTGYATQTWITALEEATGLRSDSDPITADAPGAIDAISHQSSNSPAEESAQNTVQIQTDNAKEDTLTNVVYNETGSLGADSKAKPGGAGSAAQLHVARVEVAEVAERVLDSKHPERVQADRTLSDRTLSDLAGGNKRVIASLKDSRGAAKSALGGSNLSNGAMHYRTSHHVIKKLYGEKAVAFGPFRDALGGKTYIMVAP